MEDELLIITVYRNTGNGHIDHCASCHLVRCPFVENFDCPIVSCPQCDAKLHECKVEEHVMEICPKTQIPCLNAGYGCSRIVRRFRLHYHLRRCPANVVVCTKEWARKTVSDESKLQLKAMAKGVRPTEDIPITDDQLDLAAAHSDQKVLFDSYVLPRKHRVAQRDGIHKAHPLVPLRAVYDKRGRLQEAGKHETDGDSSDEEKVILAAKLRSKKAMFANCYLCQVDPASQHLHTLGNESAKFKLGRPVRKWPKQEDKFHSANGLKIDFSVVSTSEDTHLLFRKTLYIRRCLRVVHRRELGDHELSQHQSGLDNLGQLIVRCPNWERGCGFFTSRLKPKEGRLRFQQEIDGVAHLPESETLPGGDTSLADQPDWVISKLAEYLPSAALFNLSMVSRSLRTVLFNVAEDQLLIDVTWKKDRDGWSEDGFKYFFSTADRPVTLCWQPAAALSAHLAVCEHGEKKSFQEVPEEGVEVLFDKEKWYIFTRVQGLFEWQ